MILPQPSPSTGLSINSNASAGSSLPRSLLWLVHLGTLMRGNDVQRWNEILTANRLAYTATKNDVLQAPDGSTLLSDFDHAQAADRLRTASTTDGGRTPLDVNNPLSLDDDNPWRFHYAKLGTFEQIQKDVERAFPEEEDRFASNKRQFVNQLSAILAVWSLKRENQEIGYRQGMHEIAAICWLVVFEDAAAVRQDAPVTQVKLTKDHVEADAFVLFDALMKRLSPLYVWRQPSSIGAKAESGGSLGRRNVDSSGLAIQQHCRVIQESLRANDFELHRHFLKLNVDVQLFAIRWVRLVFLREVDNIDQAITLWDGILDVDPSLHLMDHICVALLQRKRRVLLESDYSGVLRIVLGSGDSVERAPIAASAAANSTSVSMLMNEARQTHRRCMAVRSGFETVEDGHIPGSWSSLNASVPRSDIFSSYTQSVTLSDLAKSVNAQSIGANLGAGLQKALTNVQKTVSDAYQAHTAASRANANSDGFPPLTNDVSRKIPSAGSTGGLPRVPFGFGRSPLNEASSGPTRAGQVLPAKDQVEPQAGQPTRATAAYLDDRQATNKSRQDLSDPLGALHL